MLIRHKKDGTPYARPYLGKGQDGKPIRPYREFPGTTDAEAEAAAAAWLDDWGKSHGTTTPTARQALNDYVDHLKALGNSHNTIRAYRRYANAYLLDLADKPVTDITTQDLDNNMLHLLTEGARPNHPLSASTVQTYRAFLQGAWKTFTRHGLVEFNVARETMRPQATKREAIALDEADVQELVRAVRDDLTSQTLPEDAGTIARRVKALAVFLALFTGARVGEIAALRIRDVNLATSRITISGSIAEIDGLPVRQEKTKGKRIRTVTVDKDVTRVLSGHLDWIRRTFKPVTRNTPICTTDGGHMLPERLSNGFAEYRNRLGLDPALTFHSLRHTHATMLLQQGVNARVIQERLGHASVTTTLSIYGHVMPTNDYEAAQAFANIINI